MEYRDATDRLTTAPTLADLARELGVSEQTVKQARLDDSAGGYRRPPPGWNEAAAAVAERHAAELVKLARELRRMK